MERVIFNKLPSEFNLAYYLISKNENNKNKIALIDDNFSYTYEELNGFIFEIQNFFSNNGFLQNDRIAFILEDSLAFYVAFLAAVSLGIVPVLINPLLGNNIIELAIIDVKPKAIFIDELAKNVTLKNCIKLQNISCYSIHSVFSKEKKKKSTLNLNYKLVCKNDLAFIAYTSGSTGQPKGVMHAHYSPVVACVYYAENFLKLTDQDKILAGPSLAFTYGLGVSLYMPMYLGATVIVSSKKDPFSLVSFMNKFDPTVFFGVPSHFASILSIKTLLKLSNKSLRMCISAGERLPNILWQRWFEYTSIKICEGLGTTESTHIFISNNPVNPLPGTIGKVIPGYRVKLEENRQLRLYGEGLFMGYWNSPLADQNSILIKDLYESDHNGFYHFLGRNDLLVKTKGIWVLTTKIEEVALAVEGVQLAVVLVVENKNNFDINEMVLIIQKIPHFDYNLIKKNVTKLLREKLLKSEIPKTTYILSQIPLSSTGKIDRKKLCAIISKGAISELR